MERAEPPHEHGRDPAVGGALLLSLVHVPCCGVPLLVLALGLGGTATPWLGTWAEWGHWTLPIGLAAVGWSWWRLSGADDCPHVRRQRWLVAGASVLVLLSLLAHPFVHGPA